jgi:hypothetical protein
MKRLLGGLVYGLMMAAVGCSNSKPAPPPVQDEPSAMPQKDTAGKTIVPAQPKSVQSNP